MLLSTCHTPITRPCHNQRPGAVARALLTLSLVRLAALVANLTRKSQEQATMVSSDRWRRAQRYEREYWESVAKQIASGAVSQLDWYSWRADQLKKRLTALGLEHLTDGSVRVIEVGAGPIGIVSYYPGKERVAIDPLEHFYAGDPVLTELRDNDVDFIDGVGEQLPCTSGLYDLAIIDNCIDHVRDVGAVMAEVARVLRVGGIVYLTVNSRTRRGFWIHRMLSRLRIDAGHPHTFTLGRVENLIHNSGFELLFIDAGSHVEAWRNDLLRGSLKNKIKAILGVSQFLVTVVGRKSAQNFAGSDGRRTPRR